MTDLDNWKIAHSAIYLWWHISFYVCCYDNIIIFSDE